MTEHRPNYPLNVYQQALGIAWGGARSLFYGYDEPGSETVSDSPGDAQTRMLRLLAGEALDHLAKDARVLVFGARLQGLVEMLAGHTAVTYVAPPGLAGRPETDAVAGIDYFEGSLPDLPLEQRFDAAIVVGSIPYLDQLELLQQIRALLGEGGCLVWLSEFVLENGVIRYDTLSVAGTFADLAMRLGFRAEGRRDLGSGVVRTAHLLADKIVERADQIAGALGITEDQVLLANEILRRALERITHRELGVLLYRFVIEPPPGGGVGYLRYRTIRQFQPVDIGTLFEASFGKPFDAAVWQWKYGLGDGRAIAIESQGRYLAHYGGAPRKISYFADDALAMQICDVMVLPEERGHYGRNSLFFKAAATFLEREIGNTVEHLLGFGFPNLKAMRIATRLGLYEKTDEFVEIIYPHAGSIDAVDDTRFNAFDFDDTRQRAQVDRLWGRMRADFSDRIIGVRDADYLTYRYRDHPLDYQTCLIGPESAPLALAILRQMDYGHLVMDIVAGQADLQRAMIGLCRALAARGEGGEIRLRVTRTWVEAVSVDDARIVDLEIDIPCHSWSAGPAADRLAGRWWLTAGDMDFL